MKLKGLLFMTAGVFLFTACSKDGEDASALTPDGKINVTKGIEFKLDFADYDAKIEAENTRSEKQEEKKHKEYVTLSNGLLAEVAICPDTTRTTEKEKHAKTRALADDTYTMLAYDISGNLKGSVTGTVSGGIFTPTSVNKDIVIPAGQYNFICFNSKVSRNGNTLTVNRADADKALIGRIDNYTVNTVKRRQKVSFRMKHAGVKLSIILKAYYTISGVTSTISSVGSTDIPSAADYDILTGTWTAGGGATFSRNLDYHSAYPPVRNPLQPNFDTGMYFGDSKQSVYFVPNTNAKKLKVIFTGGSVYNKNMSGTSLVLNPTAFSTMSGNCSYSIRITLLYNFLYLFHDGTIGLLSKSTYGGGTKTPIGVVISRSKKLAVALKDADDGNDMPWTNNNRYQHDQVNTNGNNSEYILRTMFNGHEETWDAASSTGPATGIVKGSSSDFPAFKACGDYKPTLPPSVTLTGSIKDKKWHLPSYGEFKLMLGILAFNSSVYYYGNEEYANRILMDLAFHSVGGFGINKGNYFSSSESWGSTVYVMSPRETTSIRWDNNWSKQYEHYVRPFINY